MHLPCWIVADASAATVTSIYSSFSGALPADNTLQGFCDHSSKHTLNNFVLLPWQLSV